MSPKKPITLNDDLHIRIDGDLATRIDAIIARTKESRSSFLRRAIVIGIEAVELVNHAKKVSDDEN